MKRILLCLLAFMTIVALVSCGNGSTVGNTETSSESVTETESETVVLDTETETETGVKNPVTVQNFSPLYPEMGASVRLLNDKVWSFYDGYTPSNNNRVTSYSHKDEFPPRRCI